MRRGGTITFDVRGLPVPQGSARAFVVKGHAVVTSDNRTLADWRRLVSTVAQAHAPPQLWLGPVAVDLRFRLAQPKSRPTTVGRGKKKRRLKIRPDRKPDLDKLLRAVLDSLSNVVFRDDAQVVAIRAYKAYGVPGVRVTLWKIADREVDR